MKPEAFLINTSRGAIIDEKALLDRLKSGRLGGAALDVLIDELELGAGRFSGLQLHAKSHDNLLITPHIGGATRESMETTEVFMTEKLTKILIQQNCDH
jgi:D-3-phosphoglycerate dehydrogenase